MSLAEFVIANPYHTDHRSPLRWVTSHVLRQGWLIPVILFGAAANAALAGVVPMLIGAAFNAINRALSAPAPGAVAATVTGEAAMTAVLAAAFWIIISQALRAVLQLARNFGSEVLGQRLERDTRDELYASLLGKSMTFHGRQSAGDIMARATNDVRELNLMFNPGLNLVVGSAAFLVVPILFAPRYAPQLILTPLLFVICYAWSVRRYLRNLAPITVRARAAFGQLNSHLAETVDGIEVVKSASQELPELERFRANADAYREAFVAQGEQEARYLPLLLLGLATGLGFIHAILLYQSGVIAIGDVVGYLGLLQLFGFPTFTSLFAYSQVSLGMASAARILELITLETELGENRGGYAAPMRGEIEFEGVDFGYAPGQPALQDVSFHIQPGQTVAIVGQTGAGKTTITRLLNRVYDVDRGIVKIDGVDVRDWDLERLRRQISVIEQDLFLFSRSIAENIAFGHPDATRAEVEAAARDAQAHEFILELPEGYETVIGERGVTLSGGQRQRLAIARALLVDPRILILDDSTSAIDSATEDRIQRAMQRAARGRTMLLITHRLSQIRWADLVVVIRGGRVEACGSHESLMATCAPYRRLFVRMEDGRGGDGTRDDRTRDGQPHDGQLLEVPGIQPYETEGPAAEGPAADPGRPA
jgi:ATP-binding cassette subfamily B protein